MILKLLKSFSGFEDLRDVQKDILLIKFRHNYIHLIPQLPDFFNRDKQFQGARYNLYSLSCDCQDYVDKSGTFFFRDTRKLCRHLTTALLFDNIKKYFDPLTIRILEEQKAHGIYELYKIDEMNILAYQPISEWINAYCFEDGIWKLFGYNIKSERWARTREPLEKELILRTLKAMKN